MPAFDAIQKRLKTVENQLRCLMISKMARDAIENIIQSLNNLCGSFDETTASSCSEGIRKLRSQTDTQPFYPILAEVFNEIIKGRDDQQTIECERLGQEAYNEFLKRVSVATSYLKLREQYVTAKKPYLDEEWLNGMIDQIFSGLSLDISNKEKLKNDWSHLSNGILLRGAIVLIWNNLLRDRKGILIQDTLRIFKGILIRIVGGVSRGLSEQEREQYLIELFLLINRENEKVNVITNKNDFEFRVQSKAEEFLKKEIEQLHFYAQHQIINHCLHEQKLEEQHSSVSQFLKELPEKLNSHLEEEFKLFWLCNPNRDELIKEWTSKTKIISAIDNGTRTSYANLKKDPYTEFDAYFPDLNVDNKGTSRFELMQELRKIVKQDPKDRNNKKFFDGICRLWTIDRNKSEISAWKESFSRYKRVVIENNPYFKEMDEFVNNPYTSKQYKSIHDYKKTFDSGKSLHDTIVQKIQSAYVSFEYSKKYHELIQQSKISNETETNSLIKGIKNLFDDYHVKNKIRYFHWRSHSNEAKEICDKLSKILEDKKSDAERIENVKTCLEELQFRVIYKNKKDPAQQSSFLRRIQFSLNQLENFLGNKNAADAAIKSVKELFNEYDVKKFLCLPWRSRSKEAMSVCKELTEILKSSDAGIIKIEKAKKCIEKILLGKQDPKKSSFLQKVPRSLELLSEALGKEKLISKSSQVSNTINLNSQ